MLNLFLKTFLTVFAAELGDKSQLFMIALAGQYRPGTVICGMGAAVACLNAMAVLIGNALGHWLPIPAVSLIAGAAFLLFALTCLQEKEEKISGSFGRGRAFFTVMGSYFLAELGDKTQLTVLALSAEKAGSGPAEVWIFTAASAALFASGLLGLLAGKALQSRLSAALFRGLSCLLFAFCGIVRIFEGSRNCIRSHPHATWIAAGVTVTAALIFLLLAFWQAERKRKENFRDTGTNQPVSL